MRRRTPPTAPRSDPAADARRAGTAPAADRGTGRGRRGPAGSSARTCRAPDQGAGGAETHVPKGGTAAAPPTRGPRRHDAPDTFPRPSPDARMSAGPRTRAGNVKALPPLLVYLEVPA